MKICILASGSRGNAALLDFGRTKILVDAGISARRIEHCLAGIGVKAGEINGLLITHEHSDHIKGLEVLVRRHNIPVYARPQTWRMLSCRHSLPPGTRAELKDSFDIGSVRIEPFSISHDAVDPVGLTFYHKDFKYVVATDFGTATKTVEDALAYADALVLESNHDIQMLNKGPYPYFLKRRIRSETGHLSNDDAARLLARIPRRKSMDVLLAHLSQQNNHPDLARRTVADYLVSKGCEVGREITLHLTYQDNMTRFEK